MARMIGY